MRRIAPRGARHRRGVCIGGLTPIESGFEERKRMTVTVLLFASYADALGSPRIEISLPPGATVRDVVEQLGHLPGAERLPPRPLVAVNQRYAAADQSLSSGDEIAIVPPVAGG